ncbi:MAG: large subunit ribosomal protein L25 [Flavobacteriales bacterium]|jgi:large subunit ribosomal protein L25
MKKVSLSGSPREGVGKKDAKLLRREGRVPAVIYGGKDQTHLHMSENDAKKLVYTPDVFVIELDVNGNKIQTIVQEVQMHPVTDRIIHIDFLEVSDDKPAKVQLPITLSGFSIGVRNGGKLRQNFRRVTAVGLLNDIPEAVNVDITNLKIGDKVRVSQLDVPKVSFTDPAGAVVVAINMARGAALDEEGAEAAEEATEEAASE